MARTASNATKKAPVPRSSPTRTNGAGEGQRLASDIERGLRGLGTRERAEHEKRYLKSDLEHWGVPVPAIRKVARAAAKQVPAIERTQLWAAVEALWERGVHELRMAAVELLIAKLPLLQATDIARVEQLVREARTWALVDNLANFVAGGLVERFPDLVSTLDRWARDRDFWVRRAALLTLLIPLREGEGDFERFARYADAMLDEKEFFIRKAIGWVLRDTSKRRPELVYAWLKPRKHRASSVSLREAVKYLSAKQRAELLGRA